MFSKYYDYNFDYIKIEVESGKGQLPPNCLLGPNKFIVHDKFVLTSFESIQITVPQNVTSGSTNKNN